MKYAVIENGAVANVVEAGPKTKFPDSWTVIASEVAKIGDLFHPETEAFQTPEPEALAPTVAEYQAAIERHIDAVAQSKQYANAISAASYAVSTNPQWAAEALAFVTWRDAVWHYVYMTLAAVEKGEHAAPTIAELIAELPVIEW
jgi:hypothetical protein